jgi:D-alanyl-lipoteichoic acid acyltransferase DltB (MBOAT superfamily)
MIKEKPDILTYCAYVTFLPACLIGPVYEYKDFEDYFKRKGDYTNIPNPLKSMIKESGIFLISLVVFITAETYEIEHILTEEFAQTNIFNKFSYVLINMIGVQFKYISAWSLGMISMKASGFTYNPS